IIPRYLHGWDELEPTIIGSIAQGMSILLLGKHGCGKTSFGRFVSEALSNGEELKLIKYSMDKENLISMVGIPNADALKQGKID
ncbi:MAG: hypothetical protein GWN01_02275, partial [Nitrosopumilaceae archaeon]|nr:hypothetical protein [Nitrosopumilaceae archaeon]NIU86152.1 hypothetical protein [Nitrosopumilaceae archaeon]NIV64948.1 hypothetical protein [Nitrosopumilaceae archaeon]NIX60401.1 hypothetical protein [Nitrosopumilaceae archaeon]